MLNLGKIVETFYVIDEFLQDFIPFMDAHFINNQKDKPRRQCALHLSEIMTIVVLFHSSGFSHFKAYYHYMLAYHRSEFPNLVSYNRFTEPDP